MYLLLNEQEHSFTTGSVSTILSPDDGPKTALDMCACSMEFEYMYHLQGYSEIVDGGPIEFIGNSFGAKIAEALMHFTDCLRGLYSDLPVEYSSRYDTLPTDGAEPLCVTHRMDMLHFIGLARFYLENNQEKIEAQDFANLERLLWDINYLLMEEQLSHCPQLGNHKDPDFVVSQMENAQRLFWIQYPILSAADVCNQVYVSIDQKYNAQSSVADRKKAEFDSARASRPKGMQEVVLLHYQENEQLRKLRKQIFRNEKRAFIRHLAETCEEDLQRLGFTQRGIDYMRETGKLPEGCGYNVEHIIDREHGGTNHHHNFILMPEEINERKNDLKKAQVFNMPNSDQGAWIISWVPEKNEDGTYPEIFMGHLEDEVPAPESIPSEPLPD